MSIAAQVDADSTERNSDKPDTVSEALKGFRGVQSRALWKTLQVLPWIILFLLVTLGLVILNLHDPMFTSGVVAAVLALFAFQILMSRIPETLGSIWNRKLVKVRSASKTAAKPPAVQQEERYQKFIVDTEKLLNGFGQWITALFLALVVGTWTYFSRQNVERMMGIVSRLLYSRGPAPDGITLPTELLTGFVIVMEILTAFVLGVMAWRMIVVGVQVWRLGDTFGLQVQLGHPDQCGGFEPLGYLCLWNALILTVPAVYLGAWIILGPGTGYARYVPLFSKLLLVPMAIAIASFFLPVWGIHQQMVGQRATIRQQLDQLTRSIDVLTRELLEKADRLESDKSEELAKKLALMKQILEQNKHYPVWPFNTDILVRFLSSQIVPVLGLTGWGKDIVNVIGALADFLSES